MNSALEKSNGIHEIPISRSLETVHFLETEWDDKCGQEVVVLGRHGVKACRSSHSEHALGQSLGPRLGMVPPPLKSPSRRISRPFGKGATAPEDPRRLMAKRSSPIPSVMPVISHLVLWRSVTPSPEPPVPRSRSPSPKRDFKDSVAENDDQRRHRFSRFLGRWVHIHGNPHCRSWW